MCYAVFIRLSTQPRISADGHENNVKKDVNKDSPLERYTYPAKGQSNETTTDNQHLP